MRKFFLIAISLTSLSTHAQDSTLLHQCVVDLCGQESQYLAVRVKGPFGDAVPANVKSYLKNKGEEKITQLFDTNLANLKLKMSLVTDLIAKEDTENLSAEHLAFLAIKIMVYNYGDFLDDAVETQPGGIKFINAEKLKGKIQGVDEKKLSDLASIFSAQLSTNSYRESNKASILPYDIYKKDFLRFERPDQMESAWKIQLGEFSKQVEDIKRRFGSFAFEDIDTNALEKGKVSEDLTDSEKKSIMRTIVRIYGVQALFDGSVRSAALNSKLKLNDLLSFIGWSSRSSLIDSILSSSQGILEQRRKVQETCQRNITQAFAAAPSPLLQKKSENLAKIVKETAKKILPNYFTQRSVELASAAIDRTEISAPPNSMEIEGNLDQYLEMSLAQMQSQQARIREATQNVKDWKSLLVATVGNSSGKLQEILTSPMEKLCDKMSPAFFEDRALANISTFRMGWQTAVFHDIGAGIIAHELGHIVENAIQSQKNIEQNYVDVLKCSVENHSLLAENRPFLGKPYQYTTEDWADAFAATTLTELRKVWPYAKNYGCAMMEVDKNLKFSNFDILNLDGSDAHSTNLYRALQLHVGLGKTIPKTCEDALGSQNITVVSRQCSK